MDNESEHILIVDDSKDNLELFAYFLSEEGYRVSLASDGQEGLDKAFELQPDLIIMDLSLPVVSGWDATHRLKTDEKTKHIPVVILSAYGDDLASAVGCEASLAKPCVPDILIAEIGRILAERGSRNGPKSSPR